MWCLALLLPLLLEVSPDAGQRTRGLAFASATWLALTMSPASQLPVVELTVRPAMSRVTSSKVTEYCGAQASRWMRFCSSSESTAGKRRSRE